MTSSAGTRILLEVRRLLAAERRVERRHAVLDVDPDHGRMGGAVLAERRDDADVWILQELLLRLVQLRHVFLPRGMWASSHRW